LCSFELLFTVTGHFLFWQLSNYWKSVDRLL
jgi:hypothetical protein